MKKYTFMRLLVFFALISIFNFCSNEVSKTEISFEISNFKGHWKEGTNQNYMVVSDSQITIYEITPNFESILKNIQVQSTRITRAQNRTKWNKCPDNCNDPALLINEGHDSEMTMIVNKTDTNSMIIELVNYKTLNKWYRMYDAIDLPSFEIVNTQKIFRDEVDPYLFKVFEIKTNKKLTYGQLNLITRWIFEQKMATKYSLEISYMGPDKIEYAFFSEKYGLRLSNDTKFIND